MHLLSQASVVANGLDDARCKAEIKELILLAREGEAAQAKTMDLVNTAESELALQHWVEAEKVSQLAVEASEWRTTVSTAKLISMADDHSAADKALAEAEAKAHAGELGRRLQAAGAKIGDVTVSLMWDNTDDLDLHCEGPTGSHIFWNAKVGTCGGHLM